MTQISYREQGKGQPVILLHGFCETSRIWDGFVPMLSDRFRVICPDLPGFGKSPMLTAPFSIDDVAAEVSQWIQEMEINRPVLIGHSLGGYVALAVANKIETLITGLGLFHSTALPDSEEKKANRDKVIEFVSRNGVKPYIDTLVPGLFYKKNSGAIELTREILSEASPEALTSYVAAMRDRPDQSGLLSRFAKPFLFLCGLNDELIPVETLRKQSKLVQKGTLKILPETGHMGMLESPSESAHEVALFVSSCL